MVRSPAARSVAAVVALSALGFILRAIAMKQSLLGDELFTFEVSTRPGLRDVLAGVRSDLEVTPPLHFVAAWVTAKLGDPRFWLRVPSLLAGSAAIPLVWALGRATVGNAPALLGAALMALSPFALFYSVEARGYALLMAILATSTLVLLQAVTGRRGWLVAYAVLACAALYTHYTAVFVLAAQAAWALWAHRERRRELLLAHAAVALVFLPWLPFLIEDSESSTQTFNQALAPLSPGTLADAMATWTFGSPFTDLWQVPGGAATILIGGGVLAAAGVTLAALLRRREALTIRSELALLVSVALASPLGAVLYSLGGSSFLARNLAGSLPALLVLVAVLLLFPPRPIAMLSSVLVVLGFALGAIAALSPEQRRPPYRDAADYLDANLGAGEPILEFLAIPTRSPAARMLEINLEQAHPLFRAGFDDGTMRALRQAGSSGLAVVVTGTEGARRPPILPLRRAGLRPGRRVSFRGLVPVTVYTYRAAQADSSAVRE
jgi:mannosyltransferase